MSRFIFCILVLSSSALQTVLGAIKCSDYDWPRDRAQASDCYIHSPIELDSSTGKLLYTPKLKFTFQKNAQCTCSNEGDTVKCSVAQGVCNMTGGIFGRDMYYLDNAGMHFDLVPQNTRVMGFVDGRGSPCGAEIALYKYGQPPRSSYPDSVIRWRNFIDVCGHTPNKKFQKFSDKVLAKVQTFNKTIVVPADVCYSFLFEAFTSPYWVYPGSSVDPVTNQLTGNTIWMESRNRVIISYEQFGFLSTIYNEDLAEMSGVLPCYKQKNRPIRECNGDIKFKYLCD